MTVALVLGGAASVFTDADAALSMGEFDGVVVCNHAGIYWPGQIDAWVSLHPDKFKPWTERRRLQGLPAAKRVIGVGLVPHRFPGQEGPGSSGLFALKVALDELGFDRAVLCGVPLEPAAAHFDNPAPWPAVRVFREAWVQALPAIAHRVRSMGGWTAELLGVPDAAWIAKEP